MGGVCVCNPGSPLGRLAVLSTWLDFDHKPPPEYVHADLDWLRLGLPLQRCGSVSATALSCVVSGYVGPTRTLLRGSRRYYSACPPRPGPGAESPEPDQRRDQSAPRTRTEDSASHLCGRNGAGRGLEGYPGRRQTPCPSRRKDSDRRSGHRGQQLRRRIHGQWRAHSGRKDGRCQGYRRNDQRDGQLRDED